MKLCHLTLTPLHITPLLYMKYTPLHATLTHVHVTLTPLHVPLLVDM